MSFAEPIQQQQSNPYSSGGFNNFNLQAQMTGVPASSLQAQMTGFVPQQYFQTQKQPQFTGMNPFGGTAQQQGQQFGGQQQGEQQNASTIIGSSVQQQSIFGTPNLNNSLVSFFFVLPYGSCINSYTHTVIHVLLFFYCSR